jgi:hypothetical protein
MFILWEFYTDTLIGYNANEKDLQKYCDLLNLEGSGEVQYQILELDPIDC